MPKSVRFAAGADTKVVAVKRSRDDDGNNDDDDRKPAAKRTKRYRPNEDEMDDIDDWKKEEDGDEEVPSRVDAVASFRYHEHRPDVPRRRCRSDWIDCIFPLDEDAKATREEFVFCRRRRRA